uniref:Reverse transcriptase domain-containing protein n=1 Tax=Tanacetum cinerariifolium TaxID=118510 RepID=A0A6L2J3D8_TANCI|nr:reverse transcriptase domain-containing protein [Tanacetum cinerariifolium]
MSTMANTTPIVTTVTKTTNKKKTPKEADAALKANILEFCEKHYEEILPEEPKGERGLSKLKRWDLAHKYRNPSERPKMRDRLKYKDEDVFDRLGHQRQSAFDQLSNTYSSTKSGLNEGNSMDHSHGRGRSRRGSSSSRDCPRNKNRPRGIEESYSNTRSSYREGDRHEYHARNRNRSRSMKRGRESESPLSRVSESGTSDGGHWKTRAKRRKPADEEDLSVPWTCEDVDPFTPRIRNFKSSRKTRMPNNVKTYDETGDPEDHLIIFQAAAQVERWAMPTWCHMFNSTLIGVARVWFDELPPESINEYKGLKAVFLAYFMQQKKYVKDSVEIHNIKQRDGETIEEFMKRFKIETGRMKGAPECMRIFGFMHGVNNPELTKRLDEHVPKTVEEMMTATTAFIRGETAVTSKKKVHTLWKKVQAATAHGNPGREKKQQQVLIDSISEKDIPMSDRKKGAGPGARQGNLSRGAKIGRGRNSARSILPRLVIQPGHGEEARCVMLGEHNITYRPRTSVKGQILPDFLVEKPDDAPPEASVIETPQEP